MRTDQISTAGDYGMQWRNTWIILATKSVIRVDDLRRLTVWE
jgi:hypothetical protein